MVSIPANEPRPRGAVLAGAYALVGFVGLLTFVGAFVALGTLRGGAAATQSHQHVAAPRNDDIGRSRSTSFGAVSVESVKKVKGLTQKAIAGMTHFPSYVPPDKMQVQVVFELTNTKSTTVDYSPRQFRLRLGSGAPISLTRATFADGTLQPSASIDGQLSFIAPRRSRGTEHLWLEFKDPQRTAPIRMDLGLARTSGKVPTPTQQYHAHENQQRPPPP
jgi:hypothetical protein